MLNSVGNILESSLSAGLAKRFAVTSAIMNLWYSPCDISPSGETAVLPRHLADNCTPTMLVDGVLTVECLSPSFLYDLRWDSPGILRRLRQEVGSKVRKLNLLLADK